MPTVYRLLDVAAQYFDDNGDPYAGGKLFTYTAGSSTKKTTYQDSAGNTPHANPIVLDAAGRIPAPVFGTTGAYKFVLAPSTDTDPPASAEWTEDGISGINDTATTSIDQWIASGMAPTYVGAAQFTLVGDQTSVFHVGRRIKTTNSGGTRYGYISASSYSAPDTTVTVVNDSGSLDAGLSAVSYGLLSHTNPSLPIIPQSALNVGMVVQVVEATPLTSHQSTTAQLPTDNTIPQNTEGSEYLTVSITPTKSTNRLRIEATGLIGADSAINAGIALFQDSTADALAATAFSFAGVAYVAPFCLRHEMEAGTTSSTTFKIRVGRGGGSGAVTLNGSSVAGMFNGKAALRLSVTEIEA